MITNNDFIYLVFEKTPENLVVLDTIYAQYPEILSQGRHWDCVKKSDIQYDEHGDPVVDQDGKYVVSTEYGGLKVIEQVYNEVKHNFTGFQREEIAFIDLNKDYFSVYTSSYKPTEL